MKYKVLFVNPPTLNNRKITRNCDCASESKGNYLLQPFDFLYLSTGIPEHTEFLFIDGVAENLSATEMLAKISLFRPTHIVTAIVDLCWSIDFQFLQDLRFNNKQSKIFIFGDALVESQNRKEVLNFADAIIDNAYQFNISQTFMTEIDYSKIDGISTTIDRPITNKVPKKITFPNFPKHLHIQHENYRWPFAKHKKFTSLALNWGCPFSCSYCIDSLFPFNFRSAEDLLSELEVIRHLGFKELVITDKSFGHPRENVLTFLKGMAAYEFSWSTYIHPFQCDLELLTAMRNAGCHTIIIGIESDKIEHLKAFNRNTSVAHIRTALNNAKQVGISVCGDFLIGLPNQKLEDVQDVINYSLLLDIDYASFNIAAPLPGSSIKKLAINEGRMELNDHHYDSVGNSRVLHTTFLSSSELLKLRNIANRKFYLRPKILAKRIKNLHSFEHLSIQFMEGLQLLKNNKMDNF